MKRLFLDTSNKYLYIAVMDNDQILFSHVQEGNNNHSETLVGVLENIFKENNLSIDDISEIYVGRGPGSYTGVRVACTVAKVLAYVKNIKLFSFSSLDLLLTTNFKKGTVLAKMDARRGYSYAKAFEVTDEVKEVMAEAYIETETLNEQYKDTLVVTSESSNYDLSILLKYHLYQEVLDIHNFVPTYLRSGV